MVYQHTHMNVSEYLNVKQIVNKHGFEIQTVRSTIMRTIISNTKFANLANLFHGPVLIVYQKDGNTDELNQNAAKLLTAMKKFKKLFLLGAKTEDQIYNPEGFIKFTELPPKDQLQAQILGTLQAPGSKILSILQQNPTLLAQLLSQHKDQLDGKKEE
jgi:large subunit ribosomal protein L10